MHVRCVRVTSHDLCPQGSYGDNWHVNADCAQGPRGGAGLVAAPGVLHGAGGAECDPHDHPWCCAPKGCIEDRLQCNHMCDTKWDLEARVRVGCCSCLWWDARHDRGNTAARGFTPSLPADSVRITYNCIAEVLCEGRGRPVELTGATLLAA
jgi:hypothetical protein